MKRFKTLIGSKDESPRQGDSSDDSNLSAQALVQTQGIRKAFVNPMVHKEVMDTIPDVYYSKEADTNLHEIQRLPDNPTQELINQMRKTLMDQLAAVSKKLSEVILKHQPEYYKELQRVRELQGDLKDAHLLCTSERECLDTVSTRMCLKLLLNHHKWQNLLKLHDALTTIKTLEDTDVKLRDMVDQEKYPEAIQLCLECQKVVLTYRHYKCVTDLSSKLQDTLELIEEQIDVALSKICGNFEEEIYARLQFSYFLLGKPQTAMDQLLMHFTTCIHNTAFQVVLGFAKLCTNQPEVNLKRKQFDMLCTLVNHEDKSMYIGSLLALCKSLWNVMNYYHKISAWHFKHFNGHSGYEYKLTDFDKKYIEQKLKHGRQRVWLDVQSRVKVFLLGTDLSVFKYDEFILALDIVKRLIQIGDDFVNIEQLSTDDDQTANVTKLQSLHEPIQKQSLRYFKEHHRRCMEELKMFLENEAWEPCPMKKNFTVFELSEFKFIKAHTTLCRKISTDQNKNCGANFQFSNINDENYNPFADFEKSEKNDSSYHNLENSEDEDEYLEVGDVPKSPGHLSNEVLSDPLLTNSALNILRTCGKYMKMCDVLKSITFDVIACMCQMFDYYFYFIFSSFTDKSNHKVSQKLGTTLQRIESELIAKPQLIYENGEAQAIEPNKGVIKMEEPVCMMLNINDRGNIFGLFQRVMASESLGNLAKQFLLLSTHLESIIPDGKMAFLQQFYSQTVNTCEEVRSLLFFPVAKHFINYDNVLNQIGMVKWDINEILSQHNRYVDTLLQELETLQRSMPLVLRNMEVPEDVNKFVWHHCLHFVNNVIVEGYANVKKCSNEGRALMQLDFQQYLGKAEKLTNLKPIPGKEFVEAFIKAYYMTEEDLETWIEKHTEYSPKQLTSLVHFNASSTGSSGKRNKQKLFSLIEDITRKR